MNKRHEPSHLIKKDFERYYASKVWSTKKEAIELFIDNLTSRELGILSPMSAEAERKSNAIRVLSKVIRSERK